MNEMIQFPAPLALPVSVFCSAPLSFLMVVYSICALSLVFVFFSLWGPEAYKDAHKHLLKQWTQLKITSKGK